MLENAYDTGQLAVHTMAILAEKSVLETMCHLAGNKNLTIWMAQGNEAEDKAAKAATKCDSIVLDDTAVATLLLLDLHHRIPELPFRCIIPEAVVQDVRSLLHHRRKQKPYGYLASVGGRFVFSKPSSEEKMWWVDRLERLLTSLISHCEIIGGQATLDVPLIDRQKLIRNLGQGTTDAITTAKKFNLPVWSDDFPVVARICEKNGIPRIWTQIALESASSTLGDVVIDEAIKKLFAWKYHFIRLDLLLVINILQSAKWDSGHEDSQRLMDYLAVVGANGARNAIISLQLIICLWRMCPSQKKARELTVAFLEAVGRDAAIKMIARPLYRLQFPAKSGFAYEEMKKPYFRSLRRMLRKWRSNPHAAIFR